MGSYLSLFNTTPDTWLAKITLLPAHFSLLPDILEGVVRYINYSLRAANSQLTLARDNSNSTATSIAYVLSGMTPAILRGVLAMAGYTDEVHWTTAFRTITSQYIIDNEDCTEIDPRASLQRRAGSLSLVHRGVCYRLDAEPSQNPVQFTMRFLRMQPIFSGPTANSNNVYHMQDWINNNGINDTLTLRLSSDLPSSTTADTAMSIDWLQEFAKARLEAKQKALAEAGMDCDIGICEQLDAAQE
ncbi:hypothetical protein GOP47_0014450 [Adiantum capillus-veneris]|uniref:Uncharacterized protein n=1 Tax=Adiantum capillus-veneris TaxID=13818 RepID=A0A9D4UMB4_ADICA|nr:hypothetical protein GOP47_0014450 [Adiantum capillus-veneris]